MRQVLELIQEIGGEGNPIRRAIYQAGSVGFQIWATSFDHPRGWEGVPVSWYAHPRSPAFVAAVWWSWEGDKPTYLCLQTDSRVVHRHAQDPDHRGYLNRLEDIEWAKRKIAWLYSRVGGLVPAIEVVDWDDSVSAERVSPVQRTVVCLVEVGQPAPALSAVPLCAPVG